jgi:hypothetical protein
MLGRKEGREGGIKEGRKENTRSVNEKRNLSPLKQLLNQLLTLK